MNKAIGLVFSVLVVALSPMSPALADDDEHGDDRMSHPEVVFVDVSVASPGSVGMGWPSFGSYMSSKKAAYHCLKMEGHTLLIRRQMTTCSRWRHGL